MTGEPERLLRSERVGEALRVDLERAASHEVDYDVTAGAARFSAWLAEGGLAPPDGGGSAAGSGAAAASGSKGLLTVVGLAVVLGGGAVAWGVAGGEGAPGVAAGRGTPGEGRVTVSDLASSVEIGAGEAASAGAAADRAAPAGAAADRAVPAPAEAVDPPSLVSPASPAAPGASRAPGAEPGETPRPGSRPGSRGRRPRASRPGRALRPGPAGSNPDPARDDERLRAEMRATDRARRALATDPAAALRLAREADREFAGGLFAEDREGIAILALYGLGRTDRASRRAESFLRAHPRSSYADKIRRALGDAEKP